MLSTSTPPILIFSCGWKITEILRETEFYGNQNLMGVQQFLHSSQAPKTTSLAPGLLCPLYGLVMGLGLSLDSKTEQTATVLLMTNKKAKCMFPFLVFYFTAPSPNTHPWCLFCLLIKKQNILIIHLRKYKQSKENLYTLYTIYIISEVITVNSLLYLSFTYFL